MTEIFKPLINVLRVGLVVIGITGCGSVAIPTPWPTVSPDMAMSNYNNLPQAARAYYPESADLGIRLNQSSEFNTKSGQVSLLNFSHKTADPASVQAIYVAAESLPALTRNGSSIKGLNISVNQRSPNKDMVMIYLDPNEPLPGWVQSYPPPISLTDAENHPQIISYAVLLDSLSDAGGQMFDDPQLVATLLTTIEAVQATNSVVPTIEGITVRQGQEAWANSVARAMVLKQKGYDYETYRSWISDPTNITEGTNLVILDQNTYYKLPVIQGILR